MTEKKYLDNLKLCSSYGVCIVSLDKEYNMFVTLAAPFSKRHSMPDRGEKVYDYNNSMKFKLSMEMVSRFIFAIHNVKQGKRANDDEGVDENYRDAFSFHDTSRANLNYVEKKHLQLKPVIKENEKSISTFQLIGKISKSTRNPVYNFITVQLNKYQLYLLECYLKSYVNNVLLFRQLAVLFTGAGLFNNSDETTESSVNISDYVDEISMPTTQNSPTKEKNENKEYVEESFIFDINSFTTSNEEKTEDSFIDTCISEEKEVECSTEHEEETNPIAIETDFDTIKNNFSNVFNEMDNGLDIFENKTKIKEETKEKSEDKFDFTSFF